MSNAYPTHTPPQAPSAYAPTQGYPAAPQYFAPQKDYSGWAITGFVLSLLGFGIISLAVSIMGLRETKSGEKRGKGLALAGTVISALTVAFGLLFGLIAIIAAAGSGTAYAV